MQNLEVKKNLYKNRQSRQKNSKLLYFFNLIYILVFNCLDVQSRDLLLDSQVRRVPKL